MKRGPNKPNWPFTLNRCDQAVGLRAWWPGALTGGLVALDASGQRNNAVLSSFASPFTRTSGWTEGLDGGRGAWVFDGVDDVISLNAFSSAAFWFGAAAAFTISFWFKILAQPSNTHGFLAGVRVGATGNGYYIYWEKAGSRLLFGYQGLNGGYHFRYSSALSLSTWYHATCSRDTSNTIGGTKVAVNGTNDAGSTDTPGAPDDFSPIGSPLFCWGQDAQNTSFPSNCIMEDLKIHNRALPVATIRSLYDPDTRWQTRWQSNPIILSRSGGGLPTVGGVRPHHSRRRSLAGGFIDMDL